MIFQSLIQLYERLDRFEKVPPFGFSMEEIGFVITIDHDGKMVGEPEDLRKKITANKYEYRLSEVPFSNSVEVRSGNAATMPNFMVDKADYIFGMSGKAKKEKYQRSFIKHIEKVCGQSEDDGVVAVKKFLAGWNPEDSLNLPLWKEISGTHGKWIAFRLKSEVGFVHERPAVKQLWKEFIAPKKYPEGTSFIDGKIQPLQSQYAQFKFGTGASLVSFNEVAYESYGKKKGDNAPIGVMDEFKSATALKYLLRGSNRVYIGDTITVFWAEQQTRLETFFGQILDPSTKDDKATAQLEEFLKAVCQGTMPGDPAEQDVAFYILGFSVNKARLAIRFWFVSTVGELLQRLRDHFNNLAMEKTFENDIEFPGIWHLLKETARESKNISPVLGGEVMRAVLTGSRYPQNFYVGVLGRIRADAARKNPRTKKSVENVTYLRVSIIKAVLQRNYHQEVPMTLDKEKRDTPYLLGRLFAVLERAQLDALGKVNATIKDRFFCAASATPVTVFPRLLNLAQHHIAKSEYGENADRRIAGIMEHINGFPIHLDLQEQGLFAIGYYHQKNAIFRDIQNAAAKKKKVEANEGGKNE